MSTLYITEYVELGQTMTGTLLAAPKGARLAKQTLTISGVSNPSAAFNASTRFVRVHTDVICSIVQGPAPVADITEARMSAGQTEYYGVNPNDKIAVIANT